MSSSLSHDVDHSIAILKRIAFDPDSDRVGLWRRWEETVDLDDVTWGEHRLLVTVAARLEQAGIPRRDAARLRGMRRMAWTRNQMKLAGGRDALAVIQAAGIPCMLLKGGAMLAADLKPVRDRVMLDIDILVPPDRWHAAFAHLRDAGWTHHLRTIHDSLFHLVHSARTHAVELTAEGQRVIDLHRMSNQVTRYAAFDREMWAAAAPGRLLDVDTLIPCPADQLLLVLLHGLQAHHDGVFAWLGDARALIDGSEVDWDRFVERCRRHLLHRLVCRALEIGADYALGLPGDVAETLGRLPVDDLLATECRILERQGFAEDATAEAIFDRAQARRAGGETLLHRQPSPRNARAATPTLWKGRRSAIDCAIGDAAIRCRPTEMPALSGEGTFRLTLIATLPPLPETPTAPSETVPRHRHIHFSTEGRWLGRWRVRTGRRARRVALAARIGASDLRSICRWGLSVEPLGPDGTLPAADGVRVTDLIRPEAIHVRRSA